MCYILNDVNGGWLIHSPFQVYGCVLLYLGKIERSLTHFLPSQGIAKTSFLRIYLPLGLLIRLNEGSRNMWHNIETVI